MVHTGHKKIIFILICLVAISFTGNSYSKPGVKQAPKFAIFDLQDKLVTMTTLTKSNNLIISFWASYCVPCKREIPQLVELEKKYSEQKKVKLVLINIDKEGKDKAKPVLDSLDVTNLCLVDMYQLNAKKYIPNLKIPAVFVINKKNEIVFEAIGEGEKNLKNLEKAIQQLK